MRICILEADRPTPAQQQRFGSYADMFEAWLRPVLPEARFSRAFVAGGEAPPDPGAVDAVLITGSRAGVHDGAGWIADLAAHLRALRQHRTPMLGVCFGHQLMAEAFGGTVSRAPVGWTLGHHLHRPTAQGHHFFGDQDIGVMSCHQDQVAKAPPGTDILIASQHSPLGGLVYDFPALSVQFHPEFGPDYVQSLLDGGLGVDMPSAFARQIRSGLGGKLHRGKVAQGFARFLRRGADPDRPLG